jgi:hypothetical protein
MCTEYLLGYFVEGFEKEYLFENKYKAIEDCIDSFAFPENKFLEEITVIEHETNKGDCDLDPDGNCGCLALPNGNKEIINTRDWVKENIPSWLKDLPPTEQKQ